jgi:hypothetical protein
MAFSKGDPNACTREQNRPSKVDDQEYQYWRTGLVILENFVKEHF